jgi:hypothetical protein
MTKKETETDRVCPLCHVYGKNINLYDARNDENQIFITVATCCACKGLYHIDAENKS